MDCLPYNAADRSVLFPSARTGGVMTFDPGIMVLYPICQAIAKRGRRR